MTISFMKSPLSDCALRVYQVAEEMATRRVISEPLEWFPQAAADASAAGPSGLTIRIPLNI
jgi:hypothetical protein